MSRKKKTSLGWMAAGAFPLNPFTDSDFQDIATVLKVNQIDPTIVEEIISAGQNYYINNGQTANAPRPSTIKNSLEKIRDDTKNLKTVLGSIDSKTIDILLCSTQTLSQEDILTVIKRCTQDLKIINQATRSVLINNDFEDQGGRPIERKALRILLLELKEIFEKVTDQPARQPAHWPEQDISGPFFDFCFIVVQRVDDSIPSSTIKSQIKSVLSRPKQNP